MTRPDPRHRFDPERGRGQDGTAPPEPPDGQQDGPQDGPPVDLNEFAALQATDALLDRLAGRRPADDDLADPFVALLAELTRDVDLETDASRRFRAVLAGRTAQDGQWRLEPPSTGPIPLPTARAAAHRRDLTRGRGVIRELFRLVPAMGVAAAAVFAVAGGVVAAVTGDPGAPIAVVSGALGEPQTVSYQQVQENIESAARAVRAGDSGKARKLIDRAKDDLDKVAAPQQSALDQRITDVEESLSTASPTASPTQDPSRTPDASVPVAAPTGTETGTATATDTAGPTVTDTASPTVTDTASPTPSAVPGATGSS